MGKQRNISEALSKYLSNLDIGDNNRSSLRDARKSIRKHLRQHFPVVEGKIKFMTQGSFQYQTINRPCHPPKQQMDLDDGIYIPKSLVEMSAGEMLNCLSESLHSHNFIKSGKWKLRTDKHACARIVIAQDMHVDIPLYRAPDKEMEEIKPSKILSNDSMYGIFESRYSYITRDSVELAHKKKGWTCSDPRYILKWFEENFNKYGMRYVHVCRILKAWRDNQWPESKSPLSSILLMRMVEMIFEGKSLPKDLDNILYLVVENLEDTILNDVTDPDPTCHDILNERAERALCVAKFNQLHNTLHSVLYEQSTSDFVKRLCIEFGKFFPDDSSLCKVLATSSAGASLVAPSANATPPFYGG